MSIEATHETTVDAARWQAVTSDHGIAALRHTHWLSPEFRAYDHAPGEWAAVDGRVVGRGVEGAPISLAPGEAADHDALLLKAIERDGSLALRVFDPASPSRESLEGISVYPYTPDWVVEGRFEPAAAGETRVVRSVDGHEREESAVGVVAFEIEGEPVRITVSRAGSGFSAVIADASSGTESYRFRFLPIAAPAGDGSVTVDFNRAFLPPCAFSDQYVCPLPPPGNRLGFRVPAGERIAIRAEA